MIINFQDLAKDPLRKKALLIVEAGYEAIDIEKVVRKKIKLQNNKLSILGALTHQNIDLDNYKRIFLIGIGKGSALASLSLAKILGKRLFGGIALDILKPKITNYVPTRHLAKRGKLQTFVGTHPLPSKQNILATQKIIKLVEGLKKDDLLITFICGGGSALLCASEEELKYSILVTKLLTQSGADIKELNTVRKHLSETKAGGLAKMAYPATVVSLIISDVPTANNDLSMVASGPTVFDKTTKKDAVHILKKYNFQFPISNFQLVETPKNKKYFRKVKNILFLSNQEPILAMAQKAKELGFKPKIYSLKLRGEAQNSFAPMMKKIKSGEAMLAGGETTVTLKNPKSKFQIAKIGKGGRNQEAVLGMLVKMIQDARFKIQDYVFISFATDGRDNTEAAGAIGDFLTIEKAKKLKLDPKKYLENHNSFNFFKKTGDLIYIKPRTFNVADLVILLKQ